MTRQLVARLVARLVAVPAVLALCLVVPATPATACSCVGIERVLQEGRRSPSSGC